MHIIGRSKPSTIKYPVPSEPSPTKPSRYVLKATVRSPICHQVLSSNRQQGSKQVELRRQTTNSNSNNKQQTTNNKQQTTNNKQQTTNVFLFFERNLQF